MEERARFLLQHELVNLETQRAGSALSQRMNPISTPSIHENSLAMGSKHSKFSVEKVNIFDKDEEDSLCQEIFEREGLEKAHTARFRESIESFYPKQLCRAAEVKVITESDQQHAEVPDLS